MFSYIPFDCFRRGEILCSSFLGPLYFDGLLMPDFLYNAITRFQLSNHCSKDGTSIIAIDGISGGLHSKRQIERMLMESARNARG